MTYVQTAERAKRSYQSSQVQAEDAVGLIVRLYDGMIGYLRLAAEMFDARRFSAAADPIRRAADIVGELQAVLDLEQGADVAFNLDRLYTYARRRIMESHLQSNPAGLREVADLLEPLRDAWNEAQQRQAGQL
ncbi:MAG: flagellar export chaperone FliS [Acidobacteriota bacterium]|nr:MAG: flagellar export chaperone FliS [Acidobacteriota bacterium]